MRGALLNDGRFARWQTSPHLTQALPAAAGADQSPDLGVQPATKHPVQGPWCPPAPFSHCPCAVPPAEPVSLCGDSSRAALSLCPPAPVCPAAAPASVYAQHRCRSTGAHATSFESKAFSSTCVSTEKESFMQVTMPVYYHTQVPLKIQLWCMNW